MKHVYWVIDSVLAGHGLDRTGVVLGCCLIVLNKLPAGDAIERIQNANPEALQIPWDREVIVNFANRHRRRPTSLRTALIL